MWIKQTERKLSITLEAGMKVEFLKDWDEELAICLLNGEKVFIKKTNLSEKPPVPCEDEETKTVTKANKRGRKKV